jgi:HEPN domain-containing protein
MPEFFANSAGRHLQDAHILLAQKRWDNAVYLAGYVVECSFKVTIEQHFKHDRGAVKKYGHDLSELEGRALDRLRLLYPMLDKQLPASRVAGTALALNHPERRYFKSDFWVESDAQSAVQLAEEIYREIISKLVLNGSISSQDI